MSTKTCFLGAKTSRRSLFFRFFDHQLQRKENFLRLIAPEGSFFALSQESTPKRKLLKNYVTEPKQFVKNLEQTNRTFLPSKTLSTLHAWLWHILILPTEELTQFCNTRAYPSLWARLRDQQSHTTAWSQLDLSTRTTGMFRMCPKYWTSNSFK